MNKPDNYLASFEQDGQTVYVVWGQDVPKDGGWERNFMKGGSWSQGWGTSSDRLYLVRKRRFNVEQLPYIAKLADGSVLVEYRHVKGTEGVERQIASVRQQWKPLTGYSAALALTDDFVVRVRPQAV